jgi:hypothetical protein
MNPYLRAAARLRAQAALKLQARIDEAPIEVLDVAVIERARDDQGRFIEDDPATPDVDEAWVVSEGSPLPSEGPPPPSV